MPVLWVRGKKGFPHSCVFDTLGAAATGGGFVQFGLGLCAPVTHIGRDTVWPGLAVSLRRFWLPAPSSTDSQAVSVSPVSRLA